MLPLLTKSTSVHLDRPRQLRYTIGAIVTVEDALESPLTALPAWNEIKPAQLRTLVWGGLLAEDPLITTREVGQYIHFGDQVRVINCVSEALRLAYSGDRKQEDRKRNPQNLAA